MPASAYKNTAHFDWQSVLKTQIFESLCQIMLNDIIFKRIQSIY